MNWICCVLKITTFVSCNLVVPMKVALITVEFYVHVVKIRKAA